jgi:hypothetical protein
MGQIKAAKHLLGLSPGRKTYIVDPPQTSTLLAPNATI